MKKFALVAVSALATVAVSTAHAQEVRVYNWSDYIDESLLEKFTEETGIKITYDLFDSELSFSDPRASLVPNFISFGLLNA